jgi:hypothetical protein
MDGDIKNHYIRKNSFPLCHREDGPAREWIAGKFINSYEWYYEIKIHRVRSNAAYNSALKTYSWCKNNQRHRLNAPAFINEYRKEWYEFGVKIK